MALSSKTISGDLGEQVIISIGSSLNATQRATDGEFSENVDTTRQSPNTAHDMDLLEKWEHGDKLFGTFAGNSAGFQRYINDINEEWGQEDKYKPIYINTLSEKKSVGEQLIELKK